MQSKSTIYIVDDEKPVRAALQSVYNSPMERFFRSLKTEWVPTIGGSSFAEAEGEILDCKLGYYSQLWPNHYNGGFGSE